MRFLVQHEFYDCECDCCGTRLIVLDDNGKVVHSHFDFFHYESIAEARRDSAADFSSHAGRAVTEDEIEVDPKFYCGWEGEKG